MKIVIDTNRIIAAMIKSGTTRDILFKTRFSFVAPDFVKTEIQKYESLLMKKAKLSQRNFEMILSLFFERIYFVKRKDYETYLTSFTISDEKDIPFLACAKVVKAQGIWTHDPHFTEQNEFKVFTNIDMLKMR